MRRRPSLLSISFRLESAPDLSHSLPYDPGAYREKMWEPEEGIGSFSIFLFRLRNEVFELLDGD